jgi:hypothetical protein
MNEKEIRTRDAEELAREIDPAPEVIELTDRVRELENYTKKIKTDYGQMRNFFRALRESVATLSPQPVEYKHPTKKSEVTNPVEAVMQSTDGHMGENQEPDEIEGINEYSPEISVNRQMFFSKSAVEWVELHRHAYTIDVLHHICTGDMISGDIHRELSVTNAFPTPVQVARAGVLFADQIAYEAPHFKKVVVHYVTDDNHSRLTKYPQSKESGYNSLNYLVAFIASERLRDHENVTFNIYPMYQKVIQVLNRKYLISHGHKVRGWAGFPWYGIERKMGREAVKRMLDKKNMFDKIVGGHFHTPLAHPWFWLGGSVSGTSTYDHQEGRYAPPSQPAWLVHPKWGEFDRTDFDLTGA